MRKINCEQCGEPLRYDDLVILNRDGEYFCNRECEMEFLSGYYGGDEYCLTKDDFEE